MVALSEDYFANNSEQYTEKSDTTKQLFDQSEYKDHEKELKSSLLLLANCVYVVTSTILHERKLIPASAFKNFNVYGDIQGYLIDSKETYGEVVATKFKEVSDAIINMTIRKFALIAELDDVDSPVEAFIWTFKFASSDNIITELGFNGSKHNFTVQYRNMTDTCRQFCHLFSKLKSVLENLEPLPKYAIPSFRTASLESCKLRGYHSVDEFVKMDQFNIGKVRFPHEEAQLTFASKYRKENDRRETLVFDGTQFSETRVTERIDRDSFEIETTRNEMDQIEEEAEKSIDMIRTTKQDSSASTLSIRNDVSMDDENIELLTEDNGISLCVQPNLVSQNENCDKSVDTAYLGGMDIYSKLQVSPEKIEKQPEGRKYARVSSIQDIVSISGEEVEEKRPKRRYGIGKNLKSKDSEKAMEPPKKSHFARVPSVKSLASKKVAKKYGTSEVFK